MSVAEEYWPVGVTLAERLKDAADKVQSLTSEGFKPEFDGEIIYWWREETVKEKKAEEAAVHLKYIEDYNRFAEYFGEPIFEKFIVGRLEECGARYNKINPRPEVRITG